MNNENIAPLKQKFCDTLGLTWPKDLVYPDIPFYYTEASGAATAEIYPTLVTLGLSVDQDPQCVFESGELFD